MPKRKQQQWLSKGNKEQVRKYKRILRTKGEKALKEEMWKDFEAFRKPVEKKLSSLTGKLGPPWYANIPPERRRTVYDYWLERIRFLHPSEEPGFRRFLKRAGSLLRRIEGKVNIHYILFQLAGVAWGEYEKPLAKKLADKIMGEYDYVKWDRDKLIMAMDEESRRTRTFRGLTVDKPKLKTRTRGAPADTTINRTILCLAEHFREKLGGPRWIVIGELLNAMYGKNVFDEALIEQRYRYWNSKQSSIFGPKQLYQDSLVIFEVFVRDLRGFLSFTKG